MRDSTTTRRIGGFLFFFFLAFFFALLMAAVAAGESVMLLAATCVWVAGTERTITSVGVLLAPSPSTGATPIVNPTVRTDAMMPSRFQRRPAEP